MYRSFNCKLAEARAKVGLPDDICNEFVTAGAAAVPAVDMAAVAVGVSPPPHVTLARSTSLQYSDTGMMV